MHLRLKRFVDDLKRQSRKGRCFAEKHISFAKTLNCVILVLKPLYALNIGSDHVTAWPLHTAISDAVASALRSAKFATFSGVWYVTTTRP